MSRKLRPRKLRLLSIIPNRPVRDKWDYPRKMERHFPIKPRQPIRNSSCHFLSFPNSLIRTKNRFVKNGTANFDRNIPTEISGPPPKVISNIPVGRNRNGPFHLNSDRNFRNLWHNGKHPQTSDPENSDPENSDPLKSKLFSILFT